MSQKIQKKIWKQNTKIQKNKPIKIIKQPPKNKNPKKLKLKKSRKSPKKSIKAQKN